MKHLLARLGAPPTQGPLPAPMLPLSEVFGPTFQGEGPHTGRQAAFVRLGLCNLSCEWCDTPYTWDHTRYDVAKECPDTPIAQIHDQLTRIGTKLVVLSGGEPLIHHQTLPHLFRPQWEWHVETNGTIPPPPYWSSRVTHTSVSPKINTRDPLKKRLKPRALHAWAEHARAREAIFKFVVTHPNQLSIIEKLQADLALPNHAIWIMPEGTTPERVTATHRTLAQPILDHGWNTTTRLHTLLWGSERGH